MRSEGQKCIEETGPAYFFKQRKNCIETYIYLEYNTKALCK
jgi:hypothetical protein